MSKLIVGFSTHHNILSWVIRKATNSPCSHAYIRLPTTYGEYLVFQASKLSVNYCNWSYFLKSNLIIEEYEVELSEEQYSIAQWFMTAEVGKPYSIPQLAGFAYVVFMKFLGFKVNNPFADGDHSFVCAEIVAMCLGLPYPESLSQEDLRRWCVNHGTKI